MSIHQPFTASSGISELVNIGHHVRAYLSSALLGPGKISQWLFIRSFVSPPIRCSDMR